ncbi:hypothetical protein LX69_02738 [Breznakibacter xylanolyticus]|uniref:Uncharacterized protein n=1 Tax=Breznakibacter xylanolyticus TaxID=990 RepID=A0A2W7N7T6_9BACT|nr:hypothetical protein [Breznakibacter xylanolyticus]PZX12934.1 hypothetical protein LX69_02738 [Breznakibacter xylanolyticus]
MSDTFSFSFGNGDSQTLSVKTRQLFQEMFPRAINVEWSKGASCEEAIFYQDDNECIALFNPENGLVEYRVNHNRLMLPLEIEQAAAVHGEIMNVITVHKHPMNDDIDHYEIIFRDAHLVRYTLLLRPDGSEVSITRL